jgi:hypothetical protein
MTAMPAAPVPAVAPAPMAVVPVPVPVMAPAHLFGPEAVDLAFGGDGGTGIFVRRRQPFIFCKRMRRQRRGLRARCKRGGSGRKSSGEFQKVAAFHDISLLVLGAWCLASDAGRF